MSFLDYLDRIPDKVCRGMKPKMIRGVLHFPHPFIREIFHIAGSMVYMLGAYILYTYVHITAPIFVFLALGFWMTYQEFYLHPKKYKQELRKGILDRICRIVPFLIFLNILYK